MASEAEKQNLRFLTETICSITEQPQKQIFSGRISCSVQQEDEEEQESDDWCRVSQVNSSGQINRCRNEVWENSKGCQTENIHLYLSDMLISSIEQLQWNELKAKIDFSQPVDPCLYLSTGITAIGSEFNEAVTQQNSLTEEQQASCSFDSSPRQNKEVDGFQRHEGNSVFYAHSIDTGSDGEVPGSSSELDNAQHAEEVSVDSSRQSEEDEKAGTSPLPLEILDDPSTEHVVQALMSYFNNKRRSSTSLSESNVPTDLMASYAHAPQRLVPIPNEIPISADEFYNLDGKRIRLRGSTVWAPPKKKFIFDIESVNHKDFSILMLIQKYRCAGCGIKLDKYYAKRCRLCYYYSRLFCQCCHQGEKSRIPAQILHLWNFKEYPVCDTAFKFLKDNEEQPVFDIQAIHPGLYKKVTKLRKVRQLRERLSHMWQYVQLCPMAEQCMTINGYLRTMFESIPKRLLSLENVDVYSMLDFECVANRNLLETLEPIAFFGATHIEGCLHCQQRAFLCQVCISPEDLLFPFQLEKVYRCDGCGSLSHIKCHQAQLKQNAEHKCAKCERIRRKRIQQQRISEVPEGANSLDYNSE